MSRIIRNLVSLALLLTAMSVQAAPSSFDLVGPRLSVAVTRDGSTLPLEWVPNLAEGDRVAIKLDLPAGQGDRFRLVAAFLRGAVDRPPDAWFHDTVSGKTKGGDLSLVVPKGAQQLVLFVLPERGAGRNAIVSAVRKQPGTFVRAVQDLNQAALDRARLDTFLDLLFRIGRQDPDSVNAASQVLTRSLAIKLKTECLQQPPELQAACLTGDRETLLFADTHSSALADTLTGAPVDLAFQLSATPQGGYGSYSSYIGVVRDILRLFGAFQSSQLRFVPALARMGDGRLTLLLNTPLSFAKPASVMVVGLPAIEAAKPPPLQAAAGVPLLCAAPETVLPVEGAPLVYATRYAHDMVLRVAPDGAAGFDLPVHADARRGGFVLDRALPDRSAGATIDARIAGRWGFTPFDGPRFKLSDPRVNRWTAAPRASLVVGRSNAVTLTGEGAGCIDGITMQRGDAAAQAVSWKQDDANTIVVDVPLDKATPGTVTLTVTARAPAPPVSIVLPALQEVGRIDAVTYAAGDESAVLTGSRLDQVREVRAGKATWRPGALTRAAGADRLTLLPVDPAAAQALTAGERIVADVTFTGDRHRTAALVVAPARPVPTLLHRSVAPRPAASGTLPIALRPDDVVPQDSRVTFAFRLDPGTLLTGREVIEVATVAGDAVARIASGRGYDLQDDTTGIVAFTPRDALGASVHGPLRFRVIRDDEPSRWSPLATAVRLPVITAIACPGPTGCTITGDALFLLRSIATNDRFEAAAAVPDGYTGPALDIVLPAPASASAPLFLRLRDAPDAVGVVAR